MKAIYFIGVVVFFIGFVIYNHVKNYREETDIMEEFLFPFIWPVFAVLAILYYSAILITMIVMLIDRQIKRYHRKKFVKSLHNRK